MKIKIIWIAIALLVLIHFVIELKYFKVHNETNVDDKIIFLIEIAGNIVTTALFGLIPAGLISLIPFKQKSFSEKFKMILPFCLLAVILVLVVSTGYIAYLKDVKGIQLGPYRN
ncbi:hypothetical protein [Dyadobacter sp. 3J3]|uniref:hypothetical protein n=1 Tax=Dyadobacter sp. 3J3 TaxID=2606600 RepID=UPI0013589E01|nr:hypothetical protein [Dyadobacter sp. 3J3]